MLVVLVLIIDSSYGTVIIEERSSYGTVTVNIGDQLRHHRDSPMVKLRSCQIIPDIINKVKRTKVMRRIIGGMFIVDCMIVALLSFSMTTPHRWGMKQYQYVSSQDLIIGGIFD